MIRFASTLLLLSLVSSTINAQFLPKGLTEEERTMLPLAQHSAGNRDFTTPPAMPVRTAAEWEELDGLCIRWEGTWSRSVLRNIAKYAKEEAIVYIVTENQSAVVNHLNQNGIDQNNIVFVDEPSNSIWFRDYGQWNIYANEVEDLMWVDWIYNRPRPLDDAVPVALADLLNIPLYETTVSPTDLVNTGGNFMVDGFGTAFASELILEENEAGNPYGVSTKNEGQIDGIMEDFMGIDRYIKMNTLPYDGIHHIDMHMKLIDEETLLVGQYPTGVADGPQIDANLNYVLNNFMSVYGTPYKVIRIPMPPENGDYPNQGGAYRTYTNSVFVNKTILVPTYEEQWDTTALRIYREALPGYNVVGIDCNEIIQASGAIHCITKGVATNDPLLISHQPLDDTPYITTDYAVNALVRHASGIASATLFWTTDTAAGYQSVAMTLTDAPNNTWTGLIPYQQAGTQMFYYIHAEANSGKQQVRPITAPAGWWKFRVTGSVTYIANVEMWNLQVFPNPATDLLRITTNLNSETQVFLIDMAGRSIIKHNMFNGQVNLDISTLPSGLYVLRLNNAAGTTVQKVQVHHY